MELWLIFVPLTLLLAADAYQRRLRWQLRWRLRWRLRCRCGFSHSGRGKPPGVVFCFLNILKVTNSKDFLRKWPEICPDRLDYWVAYWVATCSEIMLRYLDFLAFDKKTLQQNYHNYHNFTWNYGKSNESNSFARTNRGDQIIRDCLKARQ